jgi:hypothetical protein
MEDWYRVTYRELERLGGSTVLVLHGYSVSRLMATVYPNHTWHPLNFVKADKHHWQHRSAKRAAMEDIQKQLGIAKLEEWYDVTPSQVAALRGACLPLHLSSSSHNCGLIGRRYTHYPGVRIVRQHSNSLYSTLKAAFPEHPWAPWKFRVPLKTAWRDVAVHKMFLEEYGAHANILKMEQWYSVSSADLMRFEPKCHRLLACV